MGEGIVDMNETTHWNLRALTWIANETEQCIKEKGTLKNRSGLEGWCRSQAQECYDFF